MGRGGDATPMPALVPLGGTVPLTLKDGAAAGRALVRGDSAQSFDLTPPAPTGRLAKLKNDLICLKAMWLQPIKVGGQKGGARGGKPAHGPPTVADAESRRAPRTRNASTRSTKTRRTNVSAVPWERGCGWRAATGGGQRRCLRARRGAVDATQPPPPLSPPFPDDDFRADFLHGRRPMLAALAAKLRANPSLAGRCVWVDAGGGTGANVAAMAEFLPLDFFKSVHIVDLCRPLLAVAKRRADAEGWTNVHVSRGDATAWAPPAAAGLAHAVTFSYSLSMIPDFHAAVDAAISYLHPTEGILGAADFYVSSHRDAPARAHSFARRAFWRAAFEGDGVILGPERRAYLDHRLDRAWEVNADGRIPYVPFIRAPWYAYLATPKSAAKAPIAATTATPAPSPLARLFSPTATFIYSVSWEDSALDRATLQTGPGDRVLTLTSGGDNALNFLLDGVSSVTCVDGNPAQSHLLEMKAAIVRALPAADAWRLLGDGHHPGARSLFESRLAPHLSQDAWAFWRARLHYFDEATGGLYWQGGHGAIVRAVRAGAAALRLLSWLESLATAPSLAVQTARWDAGWPVRFFKRAPRALVRGASAALAHTLFNRITLWFGAGVPSSQYRMIEGDGVRLSDYVARAADGVARRSHVAKDNPYYFVSLMGRFSKDACPAYLKPDALATLSAAGGAPLDALRIVTCPFLDALAAAPPGGYTAVILMDHVDWTDAAYARTLAAALAAHVAPGGRVIWRSASVAPWYVAIIEAAGFAASTLARADVTPYLDRVNMYASFGMAVKK